MAAPMGIEHEFGVPEPSYCKIKHLVGSFANAELSRLEQCLEVLNQCQHQHEKILSEFKFLQLMIFKRNGQLRKEKSIQLLKRVQACLKRYYVGNKLYKHASSLYLDIKSALVQVTTNDGAFFIPARQIWIFTLYILQKYVELLRVTSSYCIAAYEHLSCQFSTGMLIPQMLLFMGAVSRIWILSNSIKEKATEVYRQIFPLLEHISRTPSQWVEPTLIPSIEKGEDTRDSTDQSRRHEDMVQISLDCVGDLQLVHSKTEHAMHRPSQSQIGNNEEDIGEPISLKDLPVDGNSNVIKRPADAEDYGKVLCKRHKSSSHENVQIKSKKKSSKKTKKLQRKGLCPEALSTLIGGETALKKKKKKKKKRQNTVKHAASEEVKEDAIGETSMPSQFFRFTVNPNNVDTLKSKFISSRKTSEKQFSESLKSKKKKKEKRQGRKVIKSENDRGSDHTIESKADLPLAQKHIHSEGKQKDKQKKKKKQINKCETQKKPNKHVKIKSNIDKTKLQHKKSKRTRVN